ncbi:PepSY-associated TM helix domain-containing protein [Williamsia maris]|uniref:Iron-regulated membrane protein n=1 Tax=Williamsia maris TaxID=72806 RepID=A0ABT1H9U0_9NOCA|nr:PepSY-associated TM helix domain-containing protein [Williamsia maris]MCP2174423.1 putative iron-regulated membrane protein [Williamsia maris]
MLAHRWSSLVLGLVLVVVCTTGASLVYAPELLRATNSDLFASTAAERPVGFAAAFDAVRAADPGFATSYASEKDGVYVLFSDDATSNEAYFVDAGTGAINGHGDIYGGVIGFGVNVHDCGLTCEAYPGYLPWLNEASPLAGFAATADMTWGGLILAGTGLLLLVLAISGFVLWWPGIRKWRHGFRVRLGRGRFARDYDLHNVIGIVAAPALLVWALTGMNFEIPAVTDLWYSTTGGTAAADDAYEMEPSGTTGPGITLAAASAAATSAFPGSVVTAVTLPADTDGYYGFTLLDRGPDGTDADLWAHSPTYHGNRSVGVDAHDATDVKVMSGTPDGLSTEIIEQWAQPMLHYGVSVNPWWRSLWFLFGLTPLMLMITGVSTWLFRRGTTKRKKQARAARDAGRSAPAGA